MGGEKGAALRYAVTTFGCRVNQADSLRLELQLRARGATPAPVADADVVVVNSCSVTAAADQGVRQALRRAARENPDARVVATGCYATRAGQEIAALPGAPEVVSNDDKETLADRLLPGAAERFGDGPGPCGALITPGSVGRVAFMLRVQTGCDETCSYCIIPSTRGRGRSLGQRHVLAAVDLAARSGFHEVVLNGVHLGSWGRDLAPPSSLTALLRAIDAHPSQVTCRISSLEPMDCPAELVDLVASSGRFAPHFHLHCSMPATGCCGACGDPTPSTGTAASSTACATGCPTRASAPTSSRVSPASGTRTRAKRWTTWPRAP